MSTRVRLSREERRAQLVAIGVEQVAASSFDALSVEDVADAAGISRGLLFHYFPTRRDFLLAIAEAASEEFLALTEPDASLPPAERLARGLEAFVDYVGARRDAYLSIVRGAAGDPALRAVFDRTRSEVVARMLAAADLVADDADPRLLLAVRGWVAFTEEVTVAWLADPRPARDALVAVMVDALWAVAAAAGVEDALPA